MNTLLFLLLMLVSIGAVFLAFRHSLTALYVTLAVLYVITNMTAGKIAMVNFYLFAVPASCAAPLYASIFLGTDMIAETFGKKRAFYAIWLGFGSMFCLLALGLMIKWIEPVPDNPLAGALDSIFSFAPRLVLGSLVAFIVSQHFDVYFYHYLKNVHGRKLLWLRNNGSTIISQFIDSLIVFSIAFIGVIDNWFTVMLTTYVIKLVVALFDTPWLYLARKVGSKERLELQDG